MRTSNRKPKNKPYNMKRLICLLRGHMMHPDAFRTLNRIHDCCLRCGKVPKK